MRAKKKTLISKTQMAVTVICVHCLLLYVIKCASTNFNQIKFVISQSNSKTGERHLFSLWVCCQTDVTKMNACLWYMWHTRWSIQNHICVCNCVSMRDWSSVKMLRPLDARQCSWCIQCFSNLSIKVRTWSIGRGRWRNSRTLMLTSTIPEWPSVEKWNPTPSVCFLCLMLNMCELNLCATVFLVCSTYCFDRFGG